MGSDAGIQTRYGNLGPRIGFAYDTSGTGNMVIRGGYGIVYFPDPFSASDELGQQPPYTVSQRSRRQPLSRWPEALDLMETPARAPLRLAACLLSTIHFRRA